MEPLKIPSELPNGSLKNLNLWPILVVLVSQLLTLKSLTRLKIHFFFLLLGTDKSCETLEKVANEAGVLVKYQKSTEHPTGKCAVLITGQDRSLVTKLDAANHFTTAHLDVAENWALVESAKIFYSAGFFLTVCPDAMLKVAQHAQAANKNFCMNLSAPFLCEFFKDPMLKVST